VEFYGYKKISLEEILSIAEENGGELKFMFLRQIAPFNIETILALLDIEWAIKKADEYGYKINKVILDSLQWKDDKFSFNNREKGIFVRPQILYSESQYPIAVEPMRKLREYRDRIGDIYLDVNKIIEMIEKNRLKYMEESGLEYMKKSLDYLVQKGKITNDRVNILDFWGLATLYYIVEVSKHISGINNYKIYEFKDKIRLANGDEFDISGYELTSKYKDKKLRFRIYDGSHIYEKENEKYKKEDKMKVNAYITLALYSGSGYILLEEDPEKPSVDQKIRDFYKEAKEKTGYDILLLVVDDEKSDYTVSIGENEIDYIINYHKHHKRNNGI